MIHVDRQSDTNNVFAITIWNGLKNRDLSQTAFSQFGSNATPENYRHFGYMVTSPNKLSIRTIDSGVENICMI